MKYRIKSRQKRTRNAPFSRKRLALAAKNGLRPIKALTPTDEQIRFDEKETQQPKKKRQPKKLHPLRLLRAAALEIELFFEKAANGIKKLFLKTKKKLVTAVESKAANQERKKIDSIPVALGVLCGCASVTVLTLSIMFLTLFLPYAKKHETVTVPDLEGKALTEIAGTLENINLTVEYENNPEIANGLIISQSAPAGATRRISAESGYYNLRVTVCKREPVTIPKDILGATQRDAELSLKNSGLSYTVAEEYSASVPKGNVISIYPESGETVEKGTSVRLTVSLGEKEATFIVPDLEGLDESEAIKRIKLSGFKVGSIGYTPSDKPLGTVISQSLRPHIYAPEGSVISIWVAAT